MVIEKYTMPDAYDYAYPSPEELSKIVSPPEPTPSPMPEWPMMRLRCTGALIMTGVDGKPWVKWI